MTNERIRHDKSVRGVKKALETMAGNRPELETLVDAFGPMLIAKAAFKEDHPLPEGLRVDDFPFDLNRFIQGESLFTTIGLMDFHGEFNVAAECLLPPMKTAFKGIARDLERIEQRFSAATVDTRECIQALVDDQQAILKKQAGQMGASFEVFKFVMGQLTRPFIEMQAEAFAPLTQGHQWLHGYCPLCGSPAAIAGLSGEGGKRWLQCSVCDHEWRFNRHTCPGCNDNDHTRHEYFFDQNSPVKAGERVDVCHNCNTYLLTIDLRQRIDPVNMQVAALGMVPLDILARDKGFTPLASTPWNSL
jgi:FdhE protein